MVSFNIHIRYLKEMNKCHEQVRSQWNKLKILFIMIINCFIYYFKHLFDHTSKTNLNIYSYINSMMYSHKRLELLCVC